MFSYSMWMRTKNDIFTCWRTGRRETLKNNCRCTTPSYRIAYEYCRPGQRKQKGGRSVSGELANVKSVFLCSAPRFSHLHPPIHAFSAHQSSFFPTVLRSPSSIFARPTSITVKHPLFRYYNAFTSFPSFNPVPSIHFHASFLLQFHYLGPQSDLGPNTGITGSTFLRSFSCYRDKHDTWRCREARSSSHAPPTSCTYTRTRPGAKTRGPHRAVRRPAQSRSPTQAGTGRPRDVCPPPFSRTTSCLGIASHFLPIHLRPHHPSAAMQRGETAVLYSPSPVARAACSVHTPSALNLQAEMSPSLTPRSSFLALAFATAREHRSWMHPPLNACVMSALSICCDGVERRHPPSLHPLSPRQSSEECTSHFMYIHLCRRYRRRRPRSPGTLHFLLLPRSSHSPPGSEAEARGPASCPVQIPQAPRPRRCADHRSSTPGETCT